MTTDELRKLRGLCERAPEEANRYNALSVSNRRRLIEFYAAARSAVPALLDRCEAAEREVAEQKDSFDDTLDDIFGLQPVNATFGDALQSLAQNVGERSREHEAMRTDRDRLAAECERLRALVNRAADVLDSCVRRHGTGEGSIAGDELRAEAKGEGK